MSLAAGTHLGPYEILAHIGGGGMGEVYKARDSRLGRLIAIKILAPDKVTDPVRKQRFFQEARAVSALNHPNIVTIHDISSENNTDYLVMEFVAGKTLEEAIPHGDFNVGQTLQCAIQIADALTSAHAAGIIHRDVKPSNLMISESGRIKVLDFGLAKLVEAPPLGPDDSTRTALAQTQEGIVVGSVPYMSPEQAEGKPVDARTDIFSLGAVLYEMCTGRRAFSGDSRASILAAVIARDPASMGGFNSNIPVELERAIMLCLRKDPNRRFQSMRDLMLTLEELKAASDSGNLTKRQITSTEQPGTRTRPITAVATVVALILAVGAGGLWWTSHRDHQVTPPALERVTFDSGLTTDPAVSPDGKLIAYASDRAAEGSLDIWVQYRGGEPIRITHNPADEYQPSFSPDGTQIVYRSDQEGGGLYIASSLGGGEPRLVARGAGKRPRFSPDGHEILFANLGLTVKNAHTLDVNVPGSPPKPVAPEFSSVIMPVWSPDGQYIMFLGIPREQDPTKIGLWIVPRSGGPATPVELDIAVPIQQIKQVALNAWLSGDRVLAEIDMSGSRHLWRARLRRKPWRIDHVEQVTFGTASASSPSVARDGTMLISNEENDLDLWSLPFDPRQGKLTGEPQRLTQDASREAFPSISTDGAKLAYSAEQSNSSRIWTMDLPSGKKQMLTASSDIDRRPAISMDGTKIAYFSLTARSIITCYLVPASGGQVQKIDGAKSLIWDWTSDGRAVIVSNVPSTPFGMALVDIKTNNVSPFLSRPHAVFQAHMSHDGRWMIAQEPGDVGVLIAPVVDNKPPAEDKWEPLGLKGVDLIRWAPDDSTIYFISSRDSFRCVWAQRLDATTKRISGLPFPVVHFHQARRSLRVYDSGEIGLAIVQDKIVIAETERTGNIWMTRLDD
jgi:eukaryotic-like serine/threonine-protein kinase